MDFKTIHQPHPHAFRALFTTASAVSPLPRPSDRAWAKRFRSRSELSRDIWRSVPRVKTLGLPSGYVKQLLNMAISSGFTH